MDCYAAQADGIVVAGRVKPHTGFRASIESGLCKMLAIGLGKQRGAEAIHARGLAENIPAVAAVAIAAAPVAMGLAIVENSYEQPYRIVGAPPERIHATDRELLVNAKALLPRIPFDDLDVLIVDWLGKNISGSGMDPNVIGLWRRLGGERRPDYRRIFVRDITPESHGNALGVGWADFTTRRLVEQIDYDAMYMNCLTANAPDVGRVPITLDNDRVAVAAALKTAGAADTPRLARVHSTLQLEHLLRIGGAVAGGRGQPARRGALHAGADGVRCSRQLGRQPVVALGAGLRSSPHHRPRRHSMTTAVAVPEPTASLRLGTPTRDAFGRALQALGRSDERIVVVDGDVNNSTRTEWFAAEFPERFFNVGIAESNLVGVAGGLAGAGKNPGGGELCLLSDVQCLRSATDGGGLPRLERQARRTHAGISIGEDGPSQMGIEDVALACSLPGVQVLVPADEVATHLALQAAIEHNGPVYMRVGRGDVPVVYESADECPFALGKAIRVRDGSDVTIVATASWSRLRWTPTASSPPVVSPRACWIWPRSSRSIPRRC